MAPASPYGDNFAEVVVVRHGETDSNLSGTIQGRLDHELNETGREQAAKVARRLSQEAKPAAVYSSDLKRAVETAKTITAACPGSKLVLDQRLTERHMGHYFQGMKKDDAIETEAYKAYASKNDRNEQLPGGGESCNQLSDRCVPCLNEIARKHKGERVVVVSHEEVIQEICRHADLTSSARRKIGNTSITVVHISGSDGRWILEKVADISHLSQDMEHASVMNQQTTESAGGKKRGKVESEETKEDSNSSSEEQDKSATRAVRAKV